MAWHGSGAASIKVHRLNLTAACRSPASQNDEEAQNDHEAVCSGPWGTVLAKPVRRITVQLRICRWNRRPDRKGWAWLCMHG